MLDETARVARSAAEEACQAGQLTRRQAVEAAVPVGSDDRHGLERWLWLSAMAHVPFQTVPHENGPEGLTRSVRSTASVQIDVGFGGKPWHTCNFPGLRLRRQVPPIVKSRGMAHNGRLL